MPTQHEVTRNSSAVPDFNDVALIDRGKNPLFDKNCARQFRRHTPYTQLLTSNIMRFLRGTLFNSQHLNLSV